MHQICDGLTLWNKKSIPLVQEWYETMFHHPEFVIDVPNEELKNESKRFSENRHDQAVLSCIAYKHEKKHKVKILWEKGEVFYKKGQAVFFSRIANTPGRKNGRPHTPVSLLWSIRHRMVNFVRDIRQFIYKHIL